MELEPAVPGNPPPPLEERRNLIQLAARKAASYTSSLPDFLCNETMTRSESRLNSVWKPKDVLTLQLSFTNQRERYTLVAINGKRPKSGSYDAVGGSRSEGEFGSLLSEVFRPATAQFDWSHREVIRNSTVYVFTYRIAAERSHYVLHYASKSVRPVEARVEYHGSVFIDPQTGEVLRLIRIADLPHGFPIVNARTTVDYDFSIVGGQNHLVPLLAQVELDTAVLETRNEIRFSDYRKFEAESSISFADKP